MSPSCEYIDRAGGTKLIKDYLSGSPNLKEFVKDFPSVDSILDVARNHSYSDENRQLLYDAICRQYEKCGLEVPDFWKEITSANSFTITTGHQLNLFGGPKYFIYKIISVIKLARELNEKQKDLNFLPVFWMATEDHDFEEINKVKVFNEIIGAKEDQTGPVGRVEVSHFSEAFEELKKALGTSKEAGELISMFNEAFKQKTWADFTRFWVDQLFGGEIVIVDGDDQELKKLFVPVAQREMNEQITDKMVTITNDKLESEGYHIQVGHRSVNLFYIEDGVRERIGHYNGEFKVHNLPKSIEPNDIINHPGSISPNALLRPVYQETILPNVAYVGGAGELAYWFQLKILFGGLNTTFPILVLRDSFVFVSQKDKEQLKNLGMFLEDLQLPEDELKKLYISRNGLKNIDFEPERSGLNEIYDQMESKISEMHRDYQQMIEAEKARMRKFIDKMELRALRDAKFKEETNLRKLIQLRNKYFPGGGLVERTSSFMEEYLELGKATYLDQLMAASNTLDSRIKVLTVNK